MRLGYTAAVSNLTNIPVKDGTVIPADVFGNVNYGAMMALYGVDLDLALEAANGGGDDIGVSDDRDDQAVSIGYQTVLDNPAGLSSAAYADYILRKSEGAPWRRRD